MAGPRPYDIQKSTQSINVTCFINTVSVQKKYENILLSQDIIKNNTSCTTTIFNPVFNFSVISQNWVVAPALPFPEQCDPFRQMF